MTATGYLVGFIIAAAVVSTVVMGGMTLLYFLEKNRTSVRRPGPAAPVRVLEPLGSSLASGVELRAAADEPGEVGELGDVGETRDTRETRATRRAG